MKEKQARSRAAGSISAFVWSILQINICLPHVAGIHHFPTCPNVETMCRQSCSLLNTSEAWSSSPSDKSNQLTEYRSVVWRWTKDKLTCPPVRLKENSLFFWLNLFMKRKRKEENKQRERIIYLLSFSLIRSTHRKERRASFDIINEFRTTPQQLF